MKRKDDGRKPSAKPTSPRFSFTSSVDWPEESRFHVESLLNENKEEKELARDGEYPSDT